MEAGDVTTYAYTIIGKMMTVAFSIRGSSIGGTPNRFLYIKTPGSKTAKKRIHGTLGRFLDNGAVTTGRCMVVSGATYITIGKTDGSVLATSTNATDVEGQITFEIN